ncbi:MAG: PAS domain-containing protein [Clostridia bacterium]|nr:PAS domain-containing protein [Clostridia bacterium]
MNTEFYQSLLNNANIGYALCKAIFNRHVVIDFYFVETNDIYEEYIGKKPNEILSMKASELFIDDSSAFEECLDLMNIKKDTAFFYSKQVDRKYNLKCFQISEDHFIHYFVDGRSFYHFNQEHEDVYHIASIGKWELNSKTGELKWSDGIYDMFEREKTSFFPSYENFYLTVHPDDVEMVKKAFTDSLQKKEIYEVDHRIVLQNGSVKWVSETCRTEYDNEGNPSKSIGIVQDITKRKTIEKLLEDSESRYRVIFEKAAIGICHHSIDGLIYNTNQKFCDMVGYTLDELCTMNYNDLIYHEDIKSGEELVRKLFSGELETVFLEQRYIKKDGSILWVDLRSNLIKDLSRKPRCYITSISDITAKKVSEEKLIESEQILKRAQKIAHVGNWELDISTKRITASDESYSIYGISKEGPYLSLQRVQEIVKFNDRKKMDEALYNLIHFDKPYDIIFTISREIDHEERVIHSIAELEKRGGSPYKVSGILRDITEQKALENELEENIRSKNLLLSNLPGMAYRCLFDREWTMTFVSNGCYELTGYEPYQLIDNYKISYNDMVIPKFREGLRKSWDRAVENKTFSREEYQIKRADGKEIWVWEQGQAIYDSQGKVVALEGFITDITERKEREKEVVYLSYHDSLTGLYNRAFFDAELHRLDTNRQLPIAIIMGDINGLKMTNDIFGHFEGDKLLKTVAKIIIKGCRKEDIIARMGGDEFCVILPKSDYSAAKEISERITAMCNDYTIGEECSIIPSISFGFAVKSDEKQTIDTVMRDAEELMYKRKLLEQKSAHGSVISSIRDTMAEKSNETKEHAERIVQLSKKVGIKLKLDEKQMNELELFATLHDLGKMSIDSQILNKKSKLTEEEWFEIRKHPEIGYRIAKSSINLYPIADFILTHHERYDGTGYPQGLAGEDIPLLSRIMAVVDAYDAMTNDRPYRKAVTKEQAIEELIACSGSQFDKNIVHIFIESI